MRLMLVCTSGGHFATMRGIEPFWSQHERVWVTDFQRDTQSLIDQEQVYWLPYQGPRDGIAFLWNTPKTFKIVLNERPDLIISTGASIAVNFAIAAKILGVQFLFIESISRSEELSLSGKIVYKFADEFYVQWPTLTVKYPKALFKGIVT